MERSLVLIKPDGVEKKVIGKIISLYEENGLNISNLKLMKADRSIAEEHYSEHKDKPFFENLVNFITRSPLCAMILEGEEAIKRVRELNGSTNPLEAKEGTIRNLYGNSIRENCVHSSDSNESAEREINIWFK
ncbi:nucleoside-diphosphate kinase [Clostridium thermobutyricum]|uniref:nucleoside-diphosphate kinase n=1 Tax=Clostridium thermobutyricum TaxID=29372 RepID=UPI0018A9E1E8|nr:nucleoside-diphosphate kinase [Clostridium thermobutyricum]